MRTHALVVTILLAHCSVSFAGPPKLHLIYVVDTDAAKIGPGMKRSQEQLDAVMKALFAADKRERYVPIVLSGKQVTPRNILDQIAAVDIAPQDTLMLWYGGPGAIRKDENHAFATSGGAISRTDVRKAIEKRRPRLGVLISDMCSAHEGQAAIPKRREPAEWDSVNDLFFFASGTVDLTAAGFGESAWSNGDGGFFTIALANTLSEPRARLDDDSDGILTWKEAFAHVRDLTDQIFQSAKTSAAASASISTSRSQRPTFLSLGTDQKLLQTVYSRHKWEHKAGSYELTKFPEWTETQGGRVVGKLRYTGEDDEFLYLHDDGRNLDLSLGSYKSYGKTKDSEKWELRQEGKWIRPGELRRTKWTMKAGFFTEATAPFWVEWQNGREGPHFEKIDADDEYIYLYDKGRNMTVRLTNGRMSWRVANGNYNNLHEGAWER
jgi:hypothetical protein